MIGGMDDVGLWARTDCIFAMGILASMTVQGAGNSQYFFGRAMRSEALNSASKGIELRDIRAVGSSSTRGEDSVSEEVIVGAYEID